MKKTIFNMLLAATCLTGITSCGDFLDAENKSNVSDVQYFSSKEGFNSLLNNAYEHLRDVYDPALFTKLFCAGTDMYCNGHSKTSDALQMYTALTPEDDDVSDLYTYCYEGIRAANAVKYYAEGAQVDEATKNQYVDEARVLACYDYYLLVNSFGGVPLMKDYVSQAATGYPKASAEEVYTYIIEELESVVAANNLKASTATAGGARVSMETAKAILAKTYLSAAWDLSKSEYFTKAAQYADQVINGRTLKGTNFADLWTADYKSDDNAEFLWDIEYDYATATNTTSGGTSWSAYFTNYLGGGEDPCKATSSTFIPTIYALHCFEKGDLRYNATFMKELPEVGKGNASGTTYYTWYKNGGSLKGYPVIRYYSAWYETDADFEAWKAEDPDNRKDTYRIPMDTNTKDAQSMAGIDIDYYDNQGNVFGSCPCIKFDDSSTASNQYNMDYRDIHVITLPDMFLVAAEAYLKAGDTATALKRLNEVHERAGLTALTSIDIEAILKESACENFGNGMRWVDLRRTGKLVEHNNLYNPDLKGTASQAIGQKTLRPIPQSAIDANDQLSAEDQNPGY